MIGIRRGLLHLYMQRNSSGHVAPARPRASPQIGSAWAPRGSAAGRTPGRAAFPRAYARTRDKRCDGNPPYTPEEIERYVEAWSQPGAAAGAINYYRASVSQSQKEAAAKLRPISAPTLVIWGERDSYLGSDLAEPDREDVPNLDRVERLADASHWVHHDEAERVNELLIDFFAPAALAPEAWSSVPVNHHRRVLPESRSVSRVQRGPRDAREPHP